MYKIKSFFLLSLLGFISNISVAQNNTSSPYTRYGYGELVDINFGQSKSMGGISSALRSKKHLNPENPASYTAVDSLNFRFEFGASFRVSNYSDAEASQSKLNGNLEYLALQLPLKRWIGVSAGIVPMSFVGYDYKITQTVPSTISGGELVSTSSYKGTGGLNRVYLGVGVSPFKNFSLGVNAFYNFGNIEHISEISFASKSINSTVQTKRVEVSDFSASFGAQYDIKFSEKRNLIIGAVMSLKSELSADATQEVLTAGVDTTNLNFDNEFDLPMIFGLGFVYTLNERLLLGFDFKKQAWSDVNFFGQKDLRDKDKYSLGVEYCPDFNSKKYFRRVSYRAGLNLSNSYYTVNGNEFNEMVLSVGFGLPIKRGLNPTLVNLGFEYGHIGKESDNLIEENFFKFTLNMTINEKWFMKRKFD